MIFLFYFLYIQLYYKKGKEINQSKVFTLFNIVIKVKGKIYDIVWDNACYDCIKYCENNIKSYDDEVYRNKTMTYDNCYEPDIKKSYEDKNCAPKFYITQFGTDKKGNQLKTSNLGMSIFEKYSISSLYSSVNNIVK